MLRVPKTQVELLAAFKFDLEIIGLLSVLQKAFAGEGSHVWLYPQSCHGRVAGRTQAHAHWSTKRPFGLASITTYTYVRTVCTACLLLLHTAVLPDLN